MGATSMSIRELQVRLPWTIKYSEDFRRSPVTHKDFAHATFHVGKALGRLQSFCDDMDHDRGIAASGASLREEYGKFVADLVVCALRLANTFPGGVLDLEEAVVRRIESKNGVSLGNTLPGEARAQNDVGPSGVVRGFIGRFSCEMDDKVELDMIDLAKQFAVPEMTASKAAVLLGCHEDRAAEIIASACARVAAVDGGLPAKRRKFWASVMRRGSGDTALTDLARGSGLYSEEEIGAMAIDPEGGLATFFHEGIAR